MQAVCLCDVTKFGSTDMIVGDSVGNLTIFANEQILNRRTLSEGCITAISIDQDLGNIADFHITMAWVQVPKFS